MAKSVMILYTGGLRKRVVSSGSVSAFPFEGPAGKQVTHLRPTFWTGWKMFTAINCFQMFSLFRWVVRHAIKR